MEVSFIRDAMNKVQEMAYPHTVQIDGRSYYDSGSRLELVKEPLYVPEELAVNSLDAFIQIICNECAELVDSTPHGVLYVSVPTYDTVKAYTEPRRELRNQRRVLVSATARDVPGFNNTTYSYEEAIIALRSRFQPSEGQQYVLDLMAKIVTDQTVQSDDNGITQRVQVHQGVGMVGNATIKPIVKLCPYRTFQEVSQPESEFLIRLNDKRELTITEADGGMWKLAARLIVKEYLVHALADFIETQAVIVML